MSADPGHSPSPHPDLPDQAERDAVTGRTGGLDDTIFVDAGAGTGKTTALVQRVGTLVVSGVPITRIAAITFTEAAASELRHRVRTHFEQLHTVAHDPPAAQRLQQAMDDLDDATFSTLHAFAHRILSDHPLAAGLPPELTMLSGIEEDAAFDRRWEAWLVALTSDDLLHPVLRQMDLVGLTIPRLRRLATALHQQQHRIPANLPRDPGPFTPPPLDLSAVLGHLDRIATLVAIGHANDPDDKLIPKLQVWVELGNRLREAADGDDTVASFTILRDLQDPPGLGNSGAKRAWGELGDGKQVRDEAKELIGHVDDVVLAQVDHLLATLAGWTAGFVADWAAQRRRSASLVFQDLLVLARNLVRDDARVRRQVAARHDHILIDEFQDTDPLQIELAVLLAAINADEVAASTDASGTVAWQGARLARGRLFFVGDPKQSIYRFRGADIAIYEGAKDFAIDQGGQLHTLTHNFRSVPGVIDWVNEVFDDLMQPRPLAQPDYLPLTADRNPSGSDVPVRWFGHATEGRAQQARTTQAEDVVGVVRAMIGSDEVRDPTSGHLRPVRARDIAILVRRHATARQLERCFDDAGVALVVEARSLVFGTDEVRDLATILTAIEDPNDAVAVVGALRHPALGCSDGDLVAFKDRGGTWVVPDDPDDPLPGDVPEDDPVGVGLRRLARLRRDRRDRTVGGFVEHVIAQLNLMELALAKPRPRDRWRRTRFVADQAHAYHVGGGDLRGFVRWLRQQEEEGVTAREHVVTDPDDDAVRVTTVHAAKGLEYPVVIVLGLDTDTTKGLHDPPLLWADGGTPEVNIGRDLKTAGYASRLMGSQHQPGERDHHALEEQRLLYVATTRARDLLVVSLHHSPRTRCHAAQLLERSDELPWVHQAISSDAPRPVPARPPVGAPDDPVAALAAFSAIHDRATLAASRPRTLAATTIAAAMADRDQDQPDDQPDDRPDDDRPGHDRRHHSAPGAGTGVGDAGEPGDVGDPGDDDGPDGDPARRAWQRGRGGSAVGRAVHAVLQSIDLATLDGVDAMVRTQVAAEGLPSEDARRVAARVRRAAEVPIVAEALASGRYWREIHVGAPITVPGVGDGGGDDDPTTVTLEGFIDLLVEVDDELVVVDWKTDSTDLRSPEEVVARYHPQAATYALALEVATGRTVPRCVFVLTGVADVARRQVEVAGEDLDQARQRLLRALSVGVAT